MELYLAHQLGNRKDVREWEIRFEKRTGINLINPFYDCPNRKDIKLLDTLNKEQIMEYLVTRDEKDCQTIVERDLALIRKSDGVVAFVTGSIGTSMEVIMAFRVFGLPVYVISDKYYMHAWIQVNSTKVFKDKEQFEEFICKKYSKG